MAVHTINGDLGDEHHELTYADSGGTSATGFILHIDDAKVTTKGELVGVIEVILQRVHELDYP